MEVEVEVVEGSKRMMMMMRLVWEKDRIRSLLLSLEDWVCRWKDTPKKGLVVEGLGGEENLFLTNEE